MKKGFAAVFLAVLCTFLFYGIRYMKSPLLTQEAVYGTYEESVYTDCYFVREETVYSAQSSGTVYNHYSDGARVGKDALVSTLYTGEVSESLLRELSTIDKKIENARASALYVNTAAEDDSNLENRIDEYKLKIIEASVHNDTRKISQYKAAINGLRQGSAVISVEAAVAGLTAEKSAAESKIGGVKQEVYAGQSGVFSTVLDGMEHILTPEKVMEYGVSDFNAITTVTGKTANQTVNAGDSICKIVNNHQWYVLCAVASERLENKKMNSSVTMRFDDIPGAEVTGRIVYISEPQDGKNVLLIESTQYLESAYSLRSSSMELVFKSYSGYRVPVSAIRTRDGVKGVLGRKNNVENFYPCDVVYTNESGEYVIIRSPENADRKLDGVDEFVLGER
ncbi:MAG: HlyD family efflux transporter periplasmic adaptor subunit [Clostridia bacterium]|nr:HlyD family efflux transporter periplasmic adaptor subunit [Clostridia bacterium]